MLQQTQVATVVPYFERFLSTFPTATDLANGSEHDVLRLWEGLGYYRRARQLHKAAQEIASRFDGTFPTSFDDVLSLPGIGRYTAGAILSIARDQPFPILEGNTVRLHSRLLNLQEDVQTTHGQRVLWSFAEQLVTRHQPGELNQALMELGSQVCTPKQPQCLACPVAVHCRGLAAGQVEQLPRTKKSMKYEDRHEVAIVIADDGHYLMRQCGPDDRWAGLWDFCRFIAPPAVSAEEDASIHPTSFNRETLDKTATAHTGYSVRTKEHLLQLKHAVTRYRIRLDCFHAELASQRAARKARAAILPTLKKDGDSSPPKTTIPQGSTWAWIHKDQLDELPLSVTGRKISNHLQRTKR